MKNIILIGFMGCGKSTVGKALANSLSRPFIDTDEYIAQKAGMTIAQIFEQYGEEYFRSLELKAARELSAENKLIVATGGGMLLNPSVREIFAETGVILFLDEPLDVIQKRLLRCKNRPLLNRPDRKAFIQELYNKRRPKYIEASDIIISCSGMAAESVSDIILEELKINNII